MDRAELEAAISAQESLRGRVPDEVVETAVAALRQQLMALDRPARRRGQATVLFADVSGFTAMSEVLDPEDLRELMNDVWERLDSVVTTWNGRVDKHIGDAVMAVWGSGSTSEADPEQAVRAALELQQAMRRYRESSGHDLRVRVGMSTGNVMLGGVGSTDEFTAMGDTVNLASRLEHAAPVDGVLISHDTYRHVKGVFAVEARPPLQVKGKRRSVRSYLVKAELPRAFRLGNRGVEGIETQMVGREREIEDLRAALNEVVEGGTARSFCVVGDAGIGKSRLLYEFEDWLRVQPADVRLFKGRADEMSAATHNFVIRDMLLSRFQIPTDTDPGPARVALRAGIEELAPGTPQRDIELLAALAGIVPDDADELRLDDSAAASAMMHRALSGFIGRVSTDTPVVVLLEDLHWADPSSLFAVEALSRHCAGLPVFVLSLARPSLFERGESPLSERVERIDLHPLDLDATAELVHEVLQNVDHLPEGVVAQLSGTAAGNPFFVEELVKALVDEEAILVDGDEWVLDLGRIEDSVRPTTISGVLNARIDSLPAPERELLESAAVIGATFWDSAVEAAAAAETDAPPISERLLELERKELVFRQPTSAFRGARQYMFKHALLHDAVYDRVLRDNRIRVHRAAAGWYIGRNETERLSATIAAHLEAAGDVGEAARWHASAGLHAAQLMAVNDAARHLTAACESEELDPDIRWAAQEKLSSILTTLGRHTDGLATADQMFVAASAVDDVDRQITALLERSFHLGRLGRFDESLEVCGHAEGIARRAPSMNPRISVLTEQGWLLTRLGRAQDAVEAGRTALDLVSDDTDRLAVWRIRSQLGAAYLALRDLAAAEEELTQAMSIATAERDRQREGACWINLGVLSASREDHDSAIERYERASAIFRDVGDLDQEALCRNNIGRERIALGDYAAGQADLEEAARLFDAAHANEHTAETHGLLALALLAVGDFGGAVRAAELSRQLAEATTNPEQLGEAWIALGAVALATGELIHGLDGSAGLAKGVSLRGDGTGGALTTHLDMVGRVLDRAGESAAADHVRLQAAKGA